MGIGVIGAAGVMALSGLLPASAATGNPVAAAISGSLAVAGQSLGGLLCQPPGTTNSFGSSLGLTGLFVDQGAGDLYAGEVSTSGVAQDVTSCPAGVGTPVTVSNVSGTFASTPPGIVIPPGTLSGCVAGNINQGGSTAITVGATAIVLISINFDVKAAGCSTATTDASATVAGVIQGVPVPPALTQVLLVGAVAGA